LRQHALSALLFFSEAEPSPSPGGWQSDWKDLAVLVCYTRD
jgi:hypothetical protein